MNPEPLKNLCKVLDAARHILPQTHIQNIIFEKSSLHGHYGNAITLFESNIKDKEVVKAVVENLTWETNLIQCDESGLIFGGL
jgi:RNA binding exosome subunit